MKKFTPKTFKDKIGCCLAAFSIELGSPVKTIDKNYIKRYNRILNKYLNRMSDLIDREILMGKR